MGIVPRHYPDWKAPSADGELVIWPQPHALLSETIENQKYLASAETVHFQGIPLPQVRTRMREFIGHDDSQPLIAAGHQTELHHPGVWMKNAVIDTIARRLNGRAMHLGVNTDAPKHLLLRWAGGSAPITDDPRLASAAWSGLLDPPTPAHLAELQRKIDQAAATWSFKPVIGALIASLRRLTLESPDLPSSLMNATHKLDWGLGLRHHALLASPMWKSEGFLLFAHDLLARAAESATHYNASLADYRREQHIRSPMRPMPDLLVSNDATEAPFWLDDLQTGTRTRPSVFRSDQGWILKLISGEEFFFDPAADGWEAARNLRLWLNQSQHRLTPRALTLMLFMRLAVVDQFVHGIGGARYDQVTDRFIALHYRMTAPAFGVATATLFFPDALNQERVCVRCVKQEGHRVKHSLLGPRKRELVAQIESLPRHSPERSTAYFAMHSDLSVRAEQGGVITRWQNKLAETQAREREEKTLFDRELFYALQPRDRLEAVIRDVNVEFD